MKSNKITFSILWNVESGAKWSIYRMVYFHFLCVFCVITSWLQQIHYLMNENNYDPKISWSTTNYTYIYIYKFYSYDCPFPISLKMKLEQNGFQKYFNNLSAMHGRIQRQTVPLKYFSTCWAVGGTWRGLLILLGSLH